MNVIERWRSLVGERSAPVAKLIERGAVRKFAEAISEPNQLYVDVKVVRWSIYDSIIDTLIYQRTLDLW